MKTLVLCIDRDNDFGEKVGAGSPIIGRENNLRVATLMGIADPEESDTNALFGAINIYDQLRREGVDAEIVTICGDKRVGLTSDTGITRQLDEVLSRIQADRCVFVTDGAEDEFILPLVTSRVRVEAVRRIIVKQNADIEGTFYVVKKALEDDKVRRTFVIPFALGLVVYGAFALAGQADKGIGAITFTIGTYFILKALHLFATARGFASRVASGLLSGELVVYTGVVALLVVVNGLLSTFAGTDYRGNLPAYVVTVAAQLIWWFVLAFIIHLSGRIIDAMLKDEDVSPYWPLPFSAIATGLIGSAILASMARALQGESLGLATIEFLQLVAGLLLALAGAASNAYLKSWNARAGVPAR
ncbi:MAG TPA: DUF373 family protein [Candidatus Thermoplasmatota archaeon]|nr:DUF373 family protein [Candidatus Thermoplasmatota archaeon]